MTLLAIETATDEVAVALAGASGPVAHLAVHAGRRHVETLHGAIDSLCRLAGIELSALSAIGVDVGPGLFTGIRVGVASAKAFATALAIPVVPATSLEVLALAAGDAHASCSPRPVVVPVVDMRRGEVAWTSPVSGEMRLGTPADLVDALRDELAPGGDRGPLLLAGDGAFRHRVLIVEEAARAGLPSPRQTELFSPPVLTLARLALERLAAGGGADPRLVLPCYLRDADVRINWESRGEGPVPAAAVAASGEGALMAFRRSALAEGPGPPPDANGVELVPMRRRHLRKVLAIEEAAFTRPWSIGVYLSELALPATRVYLVARVRSRVVGYAGCMLVAGEAHVTTIAVAPEMHRRGIGTRLLLRLLAEARARGAGHATLEVRESNHGAQDLYREFGFAPVGIRKNYYSEVNEDAVVMWAHDIDSEIYRERLERIEARLERYGNAGADAGSAGADARSAGADAGGNASHGGAVTGSEDRG